MNPTKVDLDKFAIYCHGDLLDTVQMSRVFNDSKHFVDMPMRYNEGVILSNYDSMMTASGGNPTNEDILKFVNENFRDPGSEFESWVPVDYKEKPKFTENINDSDLRNWALDLNKLWKELGRKIISDVRNSDNYSMIYADNPLVVPGGRFREFYYWDSFWVLKGLLLCEMTDTAKGMIKNFVDMVNEYGFVPNGGRIYYTKRSQPPFLTLMVKEYLDATGDDEFVKNILPTLESEHAFWMQNRSVSIDLNGETLILNRYATSINQPRPESYYEDKTLIKDLEQERGETLMTHVASAAESGWDFSSRWNGENVVENDKLLSNLITTNIVPVDLNSILAMVEKTLAMFSDLAGNTDKTNEYATICNNRMHAIEKLLWSEARGSYFDYNMETKKHTERFYISNVVPLWTKTYANEVVVQDREKKIHKYLKNEGVLDYPGGIPTSLLESGQQWDFPNAWPPSVHMAIEGMATSEVVDLQTEAEEQSQKWINSNYLTYKKTNAMFEKYNVLWEGGAPGSGGEYEVQIGFGWTNGVILDLLNRYGDKLTAPSTIDSTISPITTTSGSRRHQSNLSAHMLALLTALLGLLLL